MAQDANNYHVTYPDVYRHWNPSCERYGGGDSLVTMLMQGWTFTNDTVIYDEFWLAGTRPVTVYNFELMKGGETVKIPVITNPYVRRVIRMHGLKTRRTEGTQSEPRRGTMTVKRA